MVGLITIKNGKRILGILFGLIALVEGLLVIYIARPTMIKSIGGVLQSTIVLVGVQLVVIGAVVVLIWFLYSGKKREGLLGKLVQKEGKIGKLLPAIMLLASLALIVEGMAVAFLSSDILIGTSQGVSKKFVALAGIQLFALGMLQLSLWIRREKAERNWLFEWGAIVLTIVLLSEGLFVMGMAANTTIVGIGTILKNTIFLAGLQLFVISGIMLFLQLFHERSLLANKFGKNRMNLVISVLALIVVLEALVMAYYSEPMTMKYSDSLKDGFSKLTVALAASQLFALGMLVYSSRNMIEGRFEKKTLIKTIGLGSSIVLAVEGVLVIGIAGNTRINNELGGIGNGTVMIAGLLLMLLGLIAVFVWQLQNNRIIKRALGKGRMDLLMLSVGLAVGIGGVTLAALSANILIVGFGGVSAKYVELAGIQLILLASLMVSMWASRVDAITQRMKWFSYMVAFFMLLLIPPAILM